MGGLQLDPDRHPLMEHPNRASAASASTCRQPEGQEVLPRSPGSADVFLTNYLPPRGQKNKFDVEHIRAANPDIIYARGSLRRQGRAGRRRLDGTAFWTRSGVGWLLPRGAGWRTVPGHSGLRRL